MDKLSLSYDLEDLCSAKNRLTRDVLAWSRCFAGAAVNVIAELAGKYEVETKVLSARAKDLRRPISWSDPPGAEASHWGDD